MSGAQPGVSTKTLGESARADRPIWLALLAAVSLLYLVLTIRAARIETPTVDESAHLPAGCLYWKTGDFDLYSKNPALMKLWMSLPLALDRRVTVPRQETASQGWGPWEYGATFLEANRSRYLDLVFRARLMIVPLGLATAWLLFLWARGLFSVPTAVVLSSLFLLTPTLLGHGHLATIDAGCALTLLLALLAIRRWDRAPGLRNAALGGAAVGLAASVKFTGLLLVPVLGVLFLLRGLRGAGPVAGSSRTGRRHWIPLLRDLGVALVLTILTVNALMAFSGSFRRVEGATFDSVFLRDLQRALPGWTPIPLPQAYVKGFDAQKLDVESGEFGSYLRGEWSMKGWWYYNLFALLVKEPEPFVLLLILAPWFWRRRADRAEAGRLLAFPAVVLFLSFSLLSTLNAGIRYLLPIYPLLFLLMGPVVESLRSLRAPWLRRSGVAALLGYYVVTAVAVHPGYLSYFNPIAGGAANGPHLLLDSNMDWGQDLYRVPSLTRKLKEGEALRLLYFGGVDPTLYGLSFSLVPAEPTRGLLAVSVNFLFGFSYRMPLPAGQSVMVPPDHLAWLRGREPTEKLGSVWVFDTRGE